MPPVTIFVELPFPIVSWSRCFLAAPARDKPLELERAVFVADDPWTWVGGDIWSKMWREGKTEVFSGNHLEELVF